MSGLTSRRKGHQFEREVANDLKPIFPKACRQLEYQEGLGVDIANTEPFAFQCKNKKTYASINTIKEVPPMKDRIPVLVTKGLRMEPMAVLPWKDLVRLLKGEIL